MSKHMMGGGTYNPYAAGAPLTIYATGIRNAYDLVWHSNGNLYVPTNGSSTGGNTPASVGGSLRTDGTIYDGPIIPGLSNVRQTQKDFLFRIVKGGYYGHPNPARGEFVMNGGNPTPSKDPAQVDEYPVGTMPDANWRGFAFDFHDHQSPDGVIEYKGDKFNGALNGKLLVARYSIGNDIEVLSPGGPKNDIINSLEGSSIEGFSGFNSPLDLTEDVKTGNIYVSEFGSNPKIDLLRPKNLIDSINRKRPKLFPNPLHNKFTIQFPAQSQGNYRLQIVDIVGKTYDIGKQTISPGNTNIKVDVSKLLLHAGVYFLKICLDEAKVDIYRMIVE